MRVEAVKISIKTKEKIENKHAVITKEVENVFISGKPIFRKVRDAYMAIGLWQRYLTIIFNYNKRYKEAEVITAYPSSKWQVKMYKRRK